MLNKKYINVNFLRPKTIGKRDWGEERLLALISKKFSLKYLKIKKGKKGGLQYHRKKNECGIIISGKLKIRYLGKNGKLLSKVLKRGSVFHFPPKSIHQEIAITDTEIIEASTPHFNDRVRVEEKFGEKLLGGLKTTKKNQIKFL